MSVPHTNSWTSRAALASLLLALSALEARAQDPAPPTPPAATVTIGRVALGAGETRVMTVRSKSSMSVKASKDKAVLEETKQASEGTETIELAILELKDGKPSKVRIKILASENTMQMGGEEPEKDKSPLLGRVIELSKGEMAAAVVATDGKELEEGLVEYARERFSYFLDGKLDHDFASALPDKPMTVGEEIKVSGEVARALIFDTEDFKDVTLVITPTGMGTAGELPVGLFKLKVDVKGEADEGMTMTMNMTGELKLCAKTGRVIALTVKGSFGITGEESDPEAPAESPVVINGNGELTNIVEASYGKVD